MTLQRLFLALFTTLATATAAAQEASDKEQFYDVEVIVYASLSTDTGEEFWPALEEWPDLSNAWYFDHTPALQPLSREDYQLDAVTNALKRSSNYRPLLHFAWRQPGWGPDAALPVRINIPLDARLPVYPESQPLLTAEALTATRPWEPTRALSRDPMLLEGMLRVHRSRYLHLGLDLIYQERLGPEDALPESPDGEITEIVYQPIRMQQSRRMRSEELHYLDHPRLGIIARITPVEPEPEPETEATETTDVQPTE